MGNMMNKMHVLEEIVRISDKIYEVINCSLQIVQNTEKVTYSPTTEVSYV